MQTSQARMHGVAWWAAVHGVHRVGHDILCRGVCGILSGVLAVRKTVQWGRLTFGTLFRVPLCGVQPQLCWPWEAPSSIRVARESWGLRSSHCRAYCGILSRVLAVRKTVQWGRLTFGTLFRVPLCGVQPQLYWEGPSELPERRSSSSAPRRRGSQGASRAAPGKSGLHARGEGERVLALESREGLSGFEIAQLEFNHLH